MKIKVLALFLVLLMLMMPTVQTLASDFSADGWDAGFTSADPPDARATETPTPEPTEIPAPTPAPTEEATPSPVPDEPPATLEPEPDTPDIDTTRDASFSPAFVRGWVKISHNAPLLENPGDAAHATLAKGIGYALKRHNPGQSADCLSVTFAAGGAIQAAFIPAENLRPMSEEEIDAYLSLCAQSKEALLYNNDPAFPLLPLESSDKQPPSGEDPIDDPIITAKTPALAPLLMPVEGLVLNTSAANQAFVDEVVRLVNVERGRVGKPPLSNGYARLNEAAAVRAEEIAVRFEHTRPNNSSWSTVLTEKGVSFTAAAENIASGYTTPAAVVNGWMNSEGHRANILDERNYGLNYIGVGYVYTAGRHHWVQLFVRTTAIPATSITLSRNAMTLSVGETADLSASLTPSNNTDSVTWSSSNPAVATVSPKGASNSTAVVTGISGGTAIITATARAGVSTTCTVTVNAGPPAAVIDIAAIQGVVAPVRGAAPATSIIETAQYTGAISWSPNVTGTFAPSTQYTATITLAPKSGFTLTGVAADFFTVASAISATNGASSGVITAVFPATEAEPTYLVTINGGTGGGSYAAGATVTITAGAPPSGQRFKEWTFSPSVTFVGSTSAASAVAAFTMPAQAVTATATYEALPANTYSITVENDGNGTASATVNSAQQSEWITLTATPNSGYQFKEWQVIGGNVSISGNQFVMPDESVVVKAIFEQIPAYTLTVNRGTGGGSYAAGATVTITAVAAPSGQRFKEWTFSPSVTFVGGTSAASAIAAFTMPAQAVTATATYEALPVSTYSITVQNDGNGTASATVSSAQQSVWITLTATPNSGYQFKAWQVIGGNVSISGNQFVMPGENVVVKAIFEQIHVTAHTPIANSGGTGSSGESGTNSGIVLVDYGIPLSAPMPFEWVEKIEDLPGSDGRLSAIIDEDAVSSAIGRADKEAERKRETDGGIALVFEYSGDWTSEMNVTITADALALMQAEGILSVVVRTLHFQYSIDYAAIASLTEQCGGNDVTILITPVTELSEEAAALVGTRPMFKVTLYYIDADQDEPEPVESTITNLDAGQVMWGIAYARSREEHADSVFAVIMDENGDTRIVPSFTWAEGWVMWADTQCSMVCGVGHQQPE
ncbi:MAG: Ig-like domain-containing protein [Clostridia bacterium]|nr:Ig-like domain-containing protein [Clostridia bacterium]